MLMRVCALICLGAYAFVGSEGNDDDDDDDEYIYIDDDDDNGATAAVYIYR